jgi:hypothetical protein
MTAIGAEQKLMLQIGCFRFCPNSGIRRFARLLLAG